MNFVSLFTLFTLLLSFNTQANRYSRPSVIDIDSDSAIDYNKNWRTLAKENSKAVDKLVSILEKSKTGKILLSKASIKANEQGKSLKEVLYIGEGSLTDTTLVRKFSALNPSDVKYEMRSKVYLNKGLSVMDAVMDLAHELTHFTFKKPFNPYVNTFGLRSFISSTIEGKGGEADAFLVECRVFNELFKFKKGAKSHCTKLINPETGKVSKAKTVAYFYRVGGNFNELVSKLHQHGVGHKDIPKLNEKEAHMISSAYGLPYPAAAYEEYVTIMGKACQNDLKRLAYMKTEGRLPASNSIEDSSTSYKEARDSFNKRCSRFSN